MFSEVKLWLAPEQAAAQRNHGIIGHINQQQAAWFQYAFQLAKQCEGVIHVLQHIHHMTMSA